jgi:hypothetical protein
MSRLTYNVVRRPGGWAVEYDATVLGCYRAFEQAVAYARQLGRDGWEGRGAPSLVQVETIHGSIRTEVTFGQDTHAS